MIYLLFGDDTRRSYLMLKEFEERFRREVPSGWHMINGMEDSEAPVSVGTGSLFARKEFLIVKHPSVAPDTLKEMLMASLVRWQSDDSVVVLYEHGVPEGDFFEKLKSHASKKQEFVTLSAGDAARWLDGALKKRGAMLPQKVRAELLARYTGDIWRLESELEKILLGGEQQKARISIPDTELFALGDLWGRRERDKLLTKYFLLLKNGFSADQMFRTFLWHVKTLARVAKNNIQGIHPFVVRKSRDQIRNFSRETLESAYHDLVMLDVHDKWGKGSIEMGLLHFLLTK